MLFISYASEDSPFVGQLANDVAQAGVETWVDRQNLVPGDRWRGEVITAIEECDAMVVVLSIAASSSREVRREVEAADRRYKTIIPVIKEACDIRDMELVLRERHWIDFSTGDYSGGVRQLVTALRGGQGTVQHSSPMSSQPAPSQIIGSWQVWIQHPVFPGFGNFQFHPNGIFSGTQSQPQGTVQIQGQWGFNGAQIQIQGMAGSAFGGGPYNILLTLTEVGDGYFKAVSHDGYGTLFQWAG